MILVYTEYHNGQFTKKTLETISYARALSKDIIALTINVEDPIILQQYGVSRIIRVTNQELSVFQARAYVDLIRQIVQKKQVSTILLPSSANIRYMSPMLAIKLGASYLSNVSSLPKEGKVQKVIFSSKAIAWIPIASKQVMTLSGNIVEVTEAPVQATIEDFSVEFSKEDFPIKHLETQKFTNKISIDDASIVVSGGRGMQTPENWHIVEDLADALGAATACTKPVSDMGWRPHSEHIGQTGKPLACDLYIALGVSGAIQHIAGVSASKVKVVINSDPEAPFFKEADYGIVGNLFDIVPKLTEKIKNLPK
ncbi:electron transfer flavoprotein subunit alpha/FixB family protein [Capnocytophaga sp. oral taxon 338]|uniref:electron transfer flavoprotein subunit alpha/FixB family protein n=1 Tax=Capnocytophaga sp. oral taxon 338 TaxID=710239 RepID=UPI000202B2E4|nr:electron transfer flavoprotein subunit alpha/FixB family protein [Capnocytophaga sp. oral taxon 338]EGD35201.1 electron transfer flavoprotein alpha subunit [Capnocytophaga sp. oral taxon 338 str. F0234]